MSAQAAESSLLRVGVAVAVPVLAVTAHTAASGALPGTAGLLLVVALGVLLASLLRGRPSWWRVAALLSVGQLLGHPAASVGDAAGHPSHVLPMLAGHLVAVPVSAVLLVVIARLYALITAVLRVLTTAPQPAVVGSSAALSAVWDPRPVLVGVGVGPRAPPLSG